MLRVLTRAQHLHPRTVPSIPHTTYQISRICLHSTMAQPVASSSHPAQIPALEGPHLGQNEGKKPKEKKEKVAAAGSQSLEVRRLQLFARASSHGRAVESQARVLRPSHQDVRPAEGRIRRVGQRSALTSPSAMKLHFTLCPAQPRQEIEITMPDGSKRKGTSWETSPMDIAKEISKGLADRIVIAKVRRSSVL